MASFLSAVRKPLLVLFVLSMQAWAQSGLGVVTGTVQDPSKSAIPKASVTLVNTAKGIYERSSDQRLRTVLFRQHARRAVPSQRGSTGFATWETDFTIQAGQTVTVDPRSRGHRASQGGGE